MDATQRLVVEVMMAETADGRWAASTTGREMPRQNGKGDEVEVVELWGLVQRGEAIAHTIHDAVMLASQAHQRLLNTLERHADLRKRVKRVWRGTGQQMIEMRNGGVIWYRTRTGSGLRGVDDISRLVVDEAQHATEEHLGAVTPTLFANANPQMNVLGTGGLAGKSDWWWSQRKRALSPSPGAFGYVGHTAERVSVNDQGDIVQLPVDVEDRGLWFASNPALNTGRGQGLPFLEEQLLRLGPDSFGREHLGVWDPPSWFGAGEPKLPRDAWMASAGAGPFPTRNPGEIVLAFDVDIDGGSASITLGADTITAPYVETIEHRKDSAWLPARLVELVTTWDPIAVGCNGAGPAGAMVGPVLQAFRDAGVSADLLRQLNAVEYKQACGGFYTSVVEGQLTRPDDGPLTDAGLDAAERVLGDAWAWDRRNANVPISPLVSATICRQLLPTEPPVAPKVFAY